MVSLHTLTKIHGCLHKVAFFIIFPMSCMIAALHTYIGEFWFQYYIILHFLAISIVFVAGFVLLYKWRVRLSSNNVATITPNKMSQKIIAHIAIGSTVTLLMVVLILLFMCRHYVGDAYWYMLHAVITAIVIVGGIANICITTITHL